MTCEWWAWGLWSAGQDILARFGQFDYLCGGCPEPWWPWLYWIGFVGQHGCH